MLSILEAILLGIIQGITEWLPVSSSGHLLLIQHVLGLEVPYAYDLLLHVGTMLVIILVFWKEIYTIMIDFLTGKLNSYHGRMGMLILIGLIPGVLIGLMLYFVARSYFGNLIFLAICFLLMGVFLIFSRRKAYKLHLTMRESVVMGVAQGIAYLPGISRSGSMLGTSQYLGVKKQEALLFTFAIAIPAITGAMLFDLNALQQSGIGIPAMLAGFAAAVITGYLSLRLLIKIFIGEALHYFGYYLLAVAVLTFALAIA